MDQRMFLAVGLSMAVILGFYLLVPTPKPPLAPAKVSESAAPESGAMTRAAAGPAAGAVPAGAGPSAPAPTVAARVVHVQTPFYTADLDTRGGELVGMTLKDYKQDKNTLDWGDLIPALKPWLGHPKKDPNVPVNMVKREPGGQMPLSTTFEGDPALTQALQSAVFSGPAQDVDVAQGQPATVTLTGSAAGGLTVRKLITFHPDSYIVDYELQVINYGAAPRPLHVVSQFGLGPNTDHARTTRGHWGPMYRAKGKIHREDSGDIKGVLKVEEPQWLSIFDTYFITAVTPLSPVEDGQYTLVPGAMEGKYPVAEYAMALPPVNLEPQKMVAAKFKLFIGPKDTNEMLKFGGKLEESLDLTLDFIASPMLAMLRWFYSFTHNYGVAIIMLTIVVRVLLFPLTYKGMVSMKRMQKLQPKMASMRERLKNDKEKMNREMMEMYKKYKVNPLSGCLPIVLQIPIFFALYSALLGAIELRHSPFVGWIVDLSSMDALYVFPILMGGSMFLQQRMTPTSLDPMQAKIMMWMPVVFTFFMLNFPAGLTLYWFTSNLLSVAQQFIINRVQVPEFAD